MGLPSSGSPCCQGVALDLATIHAKVFEKGLKIKKKKKKAREKGSVDKPTRPFGVKLNCRCWCSHSHVALNPPGVPQALCRSVRKKLPRAARSHEQTGLQLSTGGDGQGEMLSDGVNYLSFPSQKPLHFSM